METNREPDYAVAQKYESVFCIFLLLLAFLWRDNPALVYPQILYLLLALLGLNLWAGRLMRQRPLMPRAAAVALGNCGVITAILSYSGGPESNLWVLFLLPVYTACLLLSDREAAWVTGGVIAFNLAFHVHGGGWRADLVFALAVKSGLFAFAAAATRHIVNGKRRAWEVMLRQQEDLRLLEERMARQETSLDQARRVAEVGWLTAGAAHDLGTPLTVILGSVGFLLKQEGLAAAEEDLRRIARAAELCRRIAGTLLGHARPAEFDPRPCELHAVMEEVLALYKTTLARSHIALERRYHAGGFKVLASPPQLQRLLLNLLSNAQAAMRQGGSLSLTTTPDGSAAVRLTIEDNGPGLPPQVLERLFEPFRSTKAEQGGTGLGLPVCREIALRHGGSLSAENRPQGGARLTLILPSGGQRTQAFLDPKDACS